MEDEGAIDRGAILNTSAVNARTRWMTYGATRRAILIASLIYISATYLVFLLPWREIASLTDEDSFFEDLGSLACFVAFLFFLLAYWKSTSGNTFVRWRTKRNVFLLLFALGMLFIGAEEISWGQRIFDVATPETLSAVNTQGELNIHNLRYFQGGSGLFSKAFNLAFLGAVFIYCGVIPVFCWLSRSFRRFIERMDLPLAPPLLCLLAVVMALTFEVIKRLSPLAMHDSIGELRESNLQILFIMMSFWFYASLGEQEDSLRGMIEAEASE